MRVYHDLWLNSTYNSTYILLRRKAFHNLLIVTALGHYENWVHSWAWCLAESHLLASQLKTVLCTAPVFSNCRAKCWNTKLKKKKKAIMTVHKISYCVLFTMGLLTFIEHSFPDLLNKEFVCDTITYEGQYGYRRNPICCDKSSNH